MSIRSWISAKKDKLTKTMSDRKRKKFDTYIRGRVQEVQGSRSASDADVLNYLLASGIDYKGQINYAFQAVGLSGSAEVGIDVLKLAGLAAGLPFLPVTLQVSSSSALAGARHRLLVVEYQNDNPTPVALEDMRGFTGTFSVGLGVKTGFELSPTKDVPGLEQVGLSFSVGATGSATANYTGTYLRVSDPRPTYYKRSDRSSGLSSDVRALLSGKDRAGGPRPKGFDPQCSFTIWTQNAEANAGLEAAIKASLAGGSAEAGATGPKVEGKFKWQGYRLQTKAADGIVMTQDAHLTYKRVSTQLLQLDLKAEAALPSDQAPEALKLPPVASKAKEDVFGLGDKTTKVFLNALSYRSATLYWDAANPTRRVVAGNGVQLGHSVSIENLAAVVDGTLDDVRRTSFVKALAAAIKVSPEILEAFLDDAKDTIADLAADPSVQPDALFLEANFAASALRLDQLFKPGAKEPTAFLDLFESSALGLETLRLRYRISDKQSNARSLIKLGFTWSVEVDFKIEKIEDYGSGGWFDAHTKAFKPATVPPAMIMA
jgi:hypothetical protein